VRLIEHAERLAARSSDSGYASSAAALLSMSSMMPPAWAKRCAEQQQDVERWPSTLTNRP